jgi:hypothetical protein
VLIVFSLHRESLKLIRVDEPLPMVVLSQEAGEVVEDFDDVGKLGQGFSLVDDLEEVDLSGGNTQRPTYVNKNLIEGQKNQVIELLREFMYCFVWEYTEMPGLSYE